MLIHFFGKNEFFTECCYESNTENLSMIPKTNLFWNSLKSETFQICVFHDKYQATNKA